MNLSWLKIACVLVLLAISGCSYFKKEYPPSSEDALKVLQERDATVRKVEIQKCRRYSLLPGEPNAPYQFQLYECVVQVERFNPELNQNWVREQKIGFRLASYVDNRWEIY